MIGFDNKQVEDKEKVRYNGRFEPKEGESWRSQKARLQRIIDLSYISDKCYCSNTKKFKWYNPFTWWK